MKKYFYTHANLIVPITVINARKHQIPKPMLSSTPVTGGTNQVCFQSQIPPLFQTNCAKSGCHDDASLQYNYVFDNNTNIVKKEVRPGNAANSIVYKVFFETANVSQTLDTFCVSCRSSRAAPSGHMDLSTYYAVTYSTSVFPVLSSNCINYHGGSTPHAGVNLSTYAGVKQQVGNGKF